MRPATGKRKGFGGILALSLLEFCEVLDGAEKSCIFCKLFRKAAAAVLENPSKVSTGSGVLVFRAGDGALCAEALVCLDTKRF